MPRESVFVRVFHGDKISVGDELTITGEKIPLDTTIITADDKDFVDHLEYKGGVKVVDKVILNVLSKLTTCPC